MLNFSIICRTYRAQTSIIVGIDKFLPKVSYSLPPLLAGHTDTALALATYKHRTGRRGRHGAWADAEEKEKEEQGGCVRCGCLGGSVGAWERESVGG